MFSSSPDRDELLSREKLWTFCAFLFARLALNGAIRASNIRARIFFRKANAGMQLTPRQNEVFEAIRELSGRGRNPSLRELAACAGLRSADTLRRHLGILQAKGLVKPSRHYKPRDLALIEKGSAIAA